MQDRKPRRAVSGTWCKDFAAAMSRGASRTSCTQGVLRTRDNELTFRVAANPGSAPASGAGDGALAIANLMKRLFRRGAETSTRWRVRSPNKNALCFMFELCVNDTGG